MDSQRRRIAENVAAWRRVAEVEAKLRAQELPQLTTARALAYLAPAFEHARQVADVPPSSGLIVQQAWVARFHERHAL